MFHGKQMKNFLIDINSFTNQQQQAQDNPSFLPLDIEQSSYDLSEDAMSYPIISTQSNRDCTQYDNTKISQILQSQLNPEYLSENHMRETQQYLNFYNDNFGSQFWLNITRDKNKGIILESRWVKIIELINGDNIKNQVTTNKRL